MKARKNREQEIDATLNSLDGAGRARPSDYFFTRLQARLQQKRENAWERMTGWIARPVVAVTGLCIILLLNGLIAVRQLEKQPAGTDYSSLQAFADEYRLEVNTFYEDDKTE